MTGISNQNRTAMIGVAVLVGLFMILAVPIIVQVSLERVLSELVIVAEEQVKFASGIKLFNFFYPFWRALIFVGGVVLLAITPAIYNREEWTYPVSMTAYALPSIGGMFMFLPYISWVGGFPLPMVISWIGMAGFWTTIFLRNRDKMEKWAQVLALTFIGMLATHAFTIGIGAQRMLWTRPGQPLYEGLQWWILTVAGEVNWIATILLVISISLLAMRKRSGWWLAIIGAFAILLIDAPTQIIRTNTLDYLYGSLLALGVLVFTLPPYFKRHLIGE
ncbi:MAG: hypothetical protein DWQ07_18925 [Chloroflexi bacterium]|nr:MAG: hypothetical protein DWQ07_18925 [Chloroflexota bacterium]MBL1195007.1 hypothetical protein [Chloroflexota bacterium]NOH12296.1 hypothetical protein [Chloroflexota bacterium]